MKKFLVNLLNKAINFIDKLGNIYLHLACAFLVAVAITFFMKGTIEIQGDKGLIDLLKELIILTMGAGIAFIPISKINHFNTSQQKRIFIAACILIISAILILPAIAILYVGSKKQDIFLLQIGGWGFFLCIFLLSLGFSIVLMTLISTIGDQLMPNKKKGE